MNKIDPGETKRHDPQPTNPSVASTQEIIVDDSTAQPMYGNFCRVMSTPEEVILDFALNPQPFSPGGHVQANERIVMNAFTAKRLLAAMATTVQRYEQTFGSIEVDLQRRVDVHHG